MASRVLIRTSVVGRGSEHYSVYWLAVGLDTYLAAQHQTLDGVIEAWLSQYRAHLIISNELIADGKRLASEAPAPPEHQRRWAAAMRVDNATLADGTEFEFRIAAEHYSERGDGLKQLVVQAGSLTGAVTHIEDIARGDLAAIQEGPGSAMAWSVVEDAELELKKNSEEAKAFIAWLAEASLKPLELRPNDLLIIRTADRGSVAGLEKMAPLLKSELAARFNGNERPLVVVLSHGVTMDRPDAAQAAELVRRLAIIAPEAVCDAADWLKVEARDP